MLEEKNDVDLPVGVSVIVPTYNREKYLKECLDSILAQEFDGPLEIIVCDDGSTDRTLEIADSYGPPVAVLRKPEGCKDQGPAPTRNRGIAASTQPLIAFLDSDDLYLPGHLQRLSQIFGKEPDVMMAFDEGQIAKNGAKWISPYLDLLKTVPGPIPLLMQCLPSTDAVMIRRSVLQQMDYAFDSTLLFAEDNDFRLRIAEKHPVRFVYGFGSVVREHSQRSVNTSQAKVRFDNDLRMVCMAENRFPYPKWVVSFRKGKIYFYHGVDEFHSRRFLSGVYYFFFGGAYLAYAACFSPKFMLKMLLRKSLASNHVNQNATQPIDK